MKDPGNGDLAKLFLSLIGNKFTIEEAKERSSLEIEEIAELISIPGSDTFFSKDSDEELKIYCNYEWISENISEKVNLREKEKTDLKDTIEDKIYSDKILNNKVNFIKSNLAQIDKNIL